MPATKLRHQLPPRPPPPARANPDDLPDDLLTNYDHAHAAWAGSVVDDLCRRLAAAEGIPADEYDKPARHLGELVYLALWVSANDPWIMDAPPELLRAPKATEGGLRFLPRPNPEDDPEAPPEPARWRTMLDRDARAIGLRIARSRRTDAPRPPPTLPGCQGKDSTCKALRRLGERFCPGCRRAELARMRGT